MKLVHITDSDRRAAIKFPALTHDAKDLAELAAILSGRHELSGQLLHEAKPGTTVTDIGATQYLILAFDEAPTGGFGEGGVYGVIKWVAEYLEPAMPLGLGAAHSEPMMWPLVGDASGLEYRIERKLFGRSEAKEQGLPVAYCALLSPVDREITQVIGNYLRDFDAPDGTPALLPISTRK